MDRRRWLKRALIALIVAVALFIVPQLLVAAGAPVEAVIAMSNLSLLALAVAFVLLVAAASVEPRWAFAVAAIALAAEIAGALLLLVREPQPAALHPEWAWYWPVVNTLYVGGLLAALVALISGAIAFVATRTGLSAAALLVGIAAAAVNRLAPYR